MLWKLKMITIS